MCHILPFTCHQCQQPQPQTLPLQTPPLCKAGWFTKTEPQDPKNLKHQKKLGSQNINNSSNISATLFDQSSPVHWEEGFPGGRTYDIRTSRLIDWFGLGADTVERRSSYLSVIFISMLRISHWQHAVWDDKHQQGQQYLVWYFFVHNTKYIKARHTNSKNKIIYIIVQHGYL